MAAHGVRQSHNPLTLRNRFVSVPLHVPGDPWSGQLGNNSTSTKQSSRIQWICSGFTCRWDACSCCHQKNSTWVCYTVLMIMHKRVNLRHWTSDMRIIWCLWFDPNMLKLSSMHYNVGQCSSSCMAVSVTDPVWSSLHVCLCTCTHVCICMCVCVCVCVCVQARTHAPRAYVCACLRVCMPAHVCAFVCVCMHVV